MARIRCLIMAVLLIGSMVQAQSNVRSRDYTINVRPEQVVWVSLNLVTTQTLAGINGRVTYDPLLLTDPVADGTGTQGFTALGNVVAPGDFRFVVYANPTKPLDLFKSTLFIRFNTTAGFTQGITTQVTYGSEAVSNLAGISLPDVDFSPVTLQTLVIRNASDSWNIYE